MTATAVRYCPTCEQVIDVKQQIILRGPLAVSIYPPWASYEGRQFVLTNQQASVLHQLAREERVSRDGAVLDNFPNSLTAERQLPVLIFHLRRKLAQACGVAVQILNIHGFGYELEIRS
jgi:DNA-binding response OmpR family regulator